MTAVYVAVYLVLQMVCVWGVYRFLKNPSVVDLSWAVGLLVSGLIYLNHAMSTRIFLIEVLLLAWALRLGGFLWYTRVRHNKVDHRYTALSDNWKVAKSLGFFINFQLQAVLIWIMACVFWFAQRAGDMYSIFDCVGLVLVIIGIIGEAQADASLYRFQQSHKGKVCKVGWWKLSRHPNYFFEWLIWCGFCCFGLSASYGWVGLISPLLLYVIFHYMSGPVTERCSLQRRGIVYQEYQQTTSFFFPIPKKLFKPVR